MEGNMYGIFRQQKNVKMVFCPFFKLYNELPFVNTTYTKSALFVSFLKFA